jgi:hypothetical protein
MAAFLRPKYSTVWFFKCHVFLVFAATCLPVAIPFPITGFWWIMAGSLQQISNLLRFVLFFGCLHY